MARFVESAVLKVIDQSTPNIKKIEKSLSRLFDSASKLAGLKFGKAFATFQGQGVSSSVRASIGALGAAYDRASARAASFANAASRVNAVLRSQAGLASSAAATLGGIRPGRAGVHAQPPQRARRSVEPFEETLRRATAWRAANEVVTLAQRGIRAGGQGVLDESTDRLRAIQQNLPKDIQKAIDAGASSAAGEFRTLTQAMINETTRAAVGNLDQMTPENARALARVVANAMTSEVVRTGDYDEAQRSSQRGAKFADLIGSASDPSKLAKAMDTWTRILIAGGKDMRSTEVLSGVKGLKTLGASLSREAMIKAGLMFDETGQRGGNELFQFVDSFMGDRITASAYEKQVKAGLRDAAGRVVDATLLATDPFRWIERHLKPRLKKKGVKFDDSEADRAKIIQEAKAFGLRGTAENLIARELIKMAERMKGVEKAMRADLSEAFNIQAPAKSIQMSLSAMSSQFKVFADRLTSDVQPYISSAFDAVSKALSKGAENISTSGKIATAAIAVAVVGGAQIVKYVIDNPGQSALTAAVTANTAAVWANTRAQAAGAIGGAIGGAGKGIFGGIFAGGLMSGAARIFAGASAAVVGAEIGDRIGSAIREVGRVAGGEHYVPKSQETVQEIRGEIERLNAQIAGIISRTHPSMRGAFNPDVERLRSEVKNLENRISSGERVSSQQAFDKIASAIKGILPPGMGGEPTGPSLKERIDNFVSGLDNGSNKAKEKLANVGTTIEGIGTTIAASGDGVASQLTNAGGAIAAALGSLASKINSVQIYGPSMPSTGPNALGLR